MALLLNDRPELTIKLTGIKSEVTMDYIVFESLNNIVFNFVFNHKHDQMSMHTKLQ